MTKLARFVWPLALGLLSARASAQASAFTALDSPRWTYEIRGVYFRPDLDNFSTFYGDNHSNYFGIAGTYRFGDRLELGGEVVVSKPEDLPFLDRGLPSGYIPSAAPRLYPAN